MKKSIMENCVILAVNTSDDTFPADHGILLNRLKNLRNDIQQMLPLVNHKSIHQVNGLYFDVPEYGILIDITGLNTFKIHQVFNKLRRKYKQDSYLFSTGTDGFLITGGHLDDGEYIHHILVYLGTLQPTLPEDKCSTYILSENKSYTFK